MCCYSCVHILTCKCLSHSVEEVRLRDKDAAPGCIDQKLSLFSSASDGILRHEELPIPPAPTSAPYALEILLDSFRTQFMDMLSAMRNEPYAAFVSQQLDDERVSSVLTNCFISHHSMSDLLHGVLRIVILSVYNCSVIFIYGSSLLVFVVNQLSWMFRSYL